MRPRCTNHTASCPADGCPSHVLAGGEQVPAGCARDMGWTPKDGPTYPVSLAAARAIIASGPEG